MAMEMDGSIARENPIREVWRWDWMWATTLVALQVEDAPSGAWMPGTAAAGGPSSRWSYRRSHLHLLLQPCAFSLVG